MFEPYAWYTAEAARLENSEKSLTFAARLFLNSLQNEQNAEVKSWKALQAKDLFERSLKINPANDSSRVDLGTTYLFGGITENPMDGILMLRKVADEKPNFIYAQMMLGHASVISGQLDKAVERYNKVIQIDATNLEATLSLAEILEKQGKKEEALLWYRKSLPLIKIDGLRLEVEKRITDLSK
jgi:tetratricopeptide (TPR) repeat protein